MSDPKKRDGGVLVPTVEPQLPTAPGATLVATLLDAKRQELNVTLNVNELGDLHAQTLQDVARSQYERPAEEATKQVKIREGGRLFRHVTVVGLFGGLGVAAVNNLTGTDLAIVLAALGAPFAVEHIIKAVRQKPGAD